MGNVYENVAVMLLSQYLKSFLRLMFWLRIRLYFCDVLIGIDSYSRCVLFIFIFLIFQIQNLGLLQEAQSARSYRDELDIVSDRVSGRPPLIASVISPNSVTKTFICVENVLPY